MESKKSSLYKKDRVEYRELLSYGIILENQIYYNQKVEYTYLVEEYLKENKGKAGVRLFQWNFFSLFRKDNQALKLFETEILT